MGGWSAEREVSLSSGAQVAAALEEEGMDVTQIVLAKSNVRDLPECNAEVIFNALHGAGGEDGVIQGYMDATGLAYTHSGLRASAVAMDKPLTKMLATAVGIRCPEGLVVGRKIPHSHPMPVPYVVKPTNQGSTIGVRIIRKETEPPCGGGAWEYDSPMMVENFIPGVELSVGLVDGLALDIIEIQPVAKYYDYVSKYSPRGSKHFLPARIPGIVRDAALAAGERLWSLLGCLDIARIDFRYDPAFSGVEGLFMLEVNTHPGLTRTSLLPEIAAANGLPFPRLVSHMVFRAAQRGSYRFADRAEHPDNV